MHDGVRFVAAQGLAQLGWVGDVAMLERTPLNRPPVAGAKIVEGDWRVTGQGQRLAGVTADVAGAAGDENAQG